MADALDAVPQRSSSSPRSRSARPRTTGSTQTAPEAVEQQPGLVGLPAGPGVAGCGQQPGGGQPRIVAQFGGPTAAAAEAAAQPSDPPTAACSSSAARAGSAPRSRRRGASARRSRCPSATSTSASSRCAARRSGERRAGRDHRAHQRLRKGDAALLDADQPGDLRRGERLDLGRRRPRRPGSGCPARRPRRARRAAAPAGCPAAAGPAGRGTRDPALRPPVGAAGSGSSPRHCPAVSTSARSTRACGLPPPIAANAVRADAAAGREPVAALAPGQPIESIGEDGAALVLGQRARVGVPVSRRGWR